jgi:hypothetical protein
VSVSEHVRKFFILDVGGGGIGERPTGAAGKAEMKYSDIKLHVSLWQESK